MMNHRKDYPVSWKDKTLYLSDLTIGIKQAYAKWLGNFMLKNAKQIMDPSDYLRYQSELMANPPRWDGNPSSAVIASIRSDNKPAMIQMTRLLFGPDGEKMTDAEIEELVLEKEKDETSDFVYAMNSIYETNDPKVEKASTSSTA